MHFLNGWSFNKIHCKQIIPKNNNEKLFIVVEYSLKCIMFNVQGKWCFSMKSMHKCDKLIVCILNIVQLFWPYVPVNIDAEIWLFFGVYYFVVLFNLGNFDMMRIKSLANQTLPSTIIWIIILIYLIIWELKIIPISIIILHCSV